MLLYAYIHMYVSASLYIAYFEESELTLRIRHFYPVR